MAQGMKAGLYARFAHELADSASHLIRHVVVAIWSRKDKVVLPVVGPVEVAFCFEASLVFHQDLNGRSGHSNEACSPALCNFDLQTISRLRYRFRNADHT